MRLRSQLAALTIALAAIPAGALTPCFVEHTSFSPAQQEAAINGCVFRVDSSRSGSLVGMARSDGGNRAAIFRPGHREAARRAPAGWRYRLLDVDGKPLPFTNQEQVLEYLRTAEVLTSKEIGRGVTKPRKLVLEKDGVRAHAVFRHVMIFEKNDKRWKDEPFRYIKDSYSNEVAAYELSRLLGLDRVPPVVLRKVNGASGSVQIWLEDMIMNVDRRDQGLQSPDETRWDQQNQILWLFDNIAGNLDRNLGNLLIDRGWSTWFIDHSRSFAPAQEPLYPEVVSQCERRLWQRLQRIDLGTVRERLHPYLDRYELNTLEARITYMVSHIRQQIASRGEGAVLFDLTTPATPVDTW